MMRLFSLYAYEADADNYGLHLDIPSGVESDVVRKVVAELAELVAKIPEGEWPEDDSSVEWEDPHESM